jgi:hypothetical protein
MKRLFLTGFLSLAAAGGAFGQLTGYTNNGSITSAPQIDATNFVNNGSMNFSLGVSIGSSTSIGVVNPSSPPFDFSDVVTFTNRGIMSDDVGWRFDTEPSVSGFAHRAAGFANQNPGQILGGSLSLSAGQGIIIIGVGAGSGSPQIMVSATNISNNGLLDVGPAGLINLAGNVVDLRHGTEFVEGFDQLAGSTATTGGLAVGALLDVGVFDNYWGIGAQSNKLTVADFTLPFPITPIHNTTNTTGQAVQQEFEIINAAGFAITNQIDGSNNLVQAVLVGDSLGLVTPTVGFEPSGDFGFTSDFEVPIIQWLAVVTNNLGQIITNTLYLEDTLGAVSNLTIVTNTVSLSGVNLLVPTNYAITRTFPGIGTFGALSNGNVPYSTALFANAFAGRNAASTNQYAALGVQLAPVTAQPDPNLPGQTTSNVTGRLQITADQYLDLTGATISSGNYLGLTATNHYAGSAQANIDFPFADINLGTTNGQLAITNLVQPSIPRFTGPIDCYSARWTNFIQITNVVNGTNGLVTNTFTQTNRFHVLMVSSSLSPTSPVFIGSLALRSTNVTISDLVNVTNSFSLNAQSFTVSSNGPGALSPVGELNLTAVNDFWSSDAPGLQFMTNSGIISLPNASYFQKRANPNFPTISDAPYQTFLNHGSIASVGGNIIWANYVENTGSPAGLALISSSVGPITLQATTAVLTNGEFSAIAGDMALTAGNLTISNHALLASGLLSLSATNLLTDGVPALNRYGVNVTNLPTNSVATNLWTAGDGFNLFVKPAAGSLLGTTVSNSCPAGLQTENTWAGADLGPVPGGFANNTAVGRLVLNGASSNSVFHFKAAGAVNALYVDVLDLENGAANRSNQGGTNIWTALNIDTNMTIYFADAVNGNLDISEKLNGANNGRLQWVSSYAGLYSSTNVTYPDGRTFAFNRPLRTSLTIDSDGDGLVNGIDSTPFPEPPPTPSSIGLTIARTGQNALISWNAQPFNTNTVLYRTPANTNWGVLTTFVSSTYGRVTVTDTMQTNRLYQVLINPAQ